MSQLGILVGIDTDVQSKVSVYRAVIADITKKAEHQYNWNFQCKMMSEAQVIGSITAGAKWLNVKLDNGKLKGSSGDLKRFTSVNGKHRPHVIISQLVNNDEKVLGYKVADYSGNVRNIKLKEMIAYGNRASASSLIPVQNAIFVPEEADKKAHYKTYPNCTFITEMVISNQNKYAQKPVRVEASKNEKTLSRLEEIYNAEQIEQLKLGKKNGVDIRIYANPALSADKMKVLRQGLESKINVKPFASPEYSSASMLWYCNDLRDGIDIKKYLNPKYTTGQLMELSLAVEGGLDISKIADINKEPWEMAEIRERLEQNIWKDELVKKDGSWS